MSPESPWRFWCRPFGLDRGLRLHVIEFTGPVPVEPGDAFDLLRMVLRDQHPNFVQDMADSEIWRSSFVLLDDDHRRLVFIARSDEKPQATDGDFVPYEPAPPGTRQILRLLERRGDPPHEPVVDQEFVDHLDAVVDHALAARVAITGSALPPVPLDALDVALSRDPRVQELRHRIRGLLDDLHARVDDEGWRIVLTYEAAVDELNSVFADVGWDLGLRHRGRHE